MSKLNSDRLWALLAFGAVVVANAKLQLGIDQAQMEALLYAVIAFIVGKSWRSSAPGAVIEAMAPALIEAATDAVDGSKDPETDVGA
jgi:hypothetical protein